METWELSEEEKNSIHNVQKDLIEKEKNKKLYEESIILIGPSGAGKSTVANELAKKTNMPRLCLDRIANRARKNGDMNKFKNADEFNYAMISTILKRAKEEGSYGIVDLGAGHSVYDDKEIFEKIKNLLMPFKNIILLLPTKDEEESLEIMKQRSTGDIRDNRKFIESPCNRELATQIVYGNYRSPSAIADEIISKIQTKQKLESEIETK